MEKKKQSKGDIFDFIDDAAKDKELHKKVVQMITSKGEGITPDNFLKEFYSLGYYDVNQRDCEKLLEIIRKDIADPSSWDWSY